MSEDQRGSCDISFKTRTVQPPAGGQEAPAAGGGQVPAAAGQEPQREAIVRLPVTPEQPDPVWQFRQVMSSLAGQFDNPHPPTLYEMVEGGDCRFEMFDARTGGEYSMYTMPLMRPCDCGNCCCSSDMHRSSVCLYVSTLGGCALHRGWRQELGACTVSSSQTVPCCDSRH